MTPRLDDQTFLLYACKHYSNPNLYDIQEFQEDLNRIKYVRRLFNRFKNKEDLQERLIVNHLLIIYNVFGVEAASRMLFYKLEGYEPLLKTFLDFLGLLPDRIENIGVFGRCVECSSIETVQEIKKKLEKM